MFKPQYTPLALVLGSLLSTPSFAAETTITDQTDNDIVISATRIESKRVETGSAITVLDEQYLKENQSRTVAEVLQDVPGVSVANTGGLGKTTSVYIRGADSNKTLVIIDGIEVNDSSSTSGGYDFAHLMADNIERIEVLRGSQSALWGSDAMGGVINIITKAGKEGFSPSLGLELGNNDYTKGVVSISGAKDSSHFSLSASQVNTEGYSARDNEADDDSYDNKTVSLKAGHNLTDIFAVDGVLRYTNAESEYDDDATTDFDSGNYSTTLQHQAKLNTHLDLLNNKWQNRLSVSFSDSEREYFSTWGYYLYEGEKIKTDLQSDYYQETHNGFTQRISFLAENEREEFESGDKYTMNSSSGVFAYGVDWQKKVFINAAIRHDHNDSFDNTTTYHIDLSAWANDGIRLHASHGTGSKNPSLYQLYGDYGNESLTAEESRSWDAGIEYNFSDVEAYVDITYFDSLYTDMIEFSASTYNNLDDKATARGVELTGSMKLTEDFRANASYTYTDSDDGDGNELVRRAKHTANINANYKYTPKLSANIGVQYASDRRDIYYDSSTWSSEETTIDSYILVNIATLYKINNHITLSARLENAFDEDYEEVYGYNTAERAAYVGISFK